MQHIQEIESFNQKVFENRELRLSQFVLDNLKDLKSKLYYYDGNFAFLTSVKDQYKKKGYLTDTQWNLIAQ